MGSVWCDGIVCRDYIMSVPIRTPFINQEKLYFNQTHIWDLFVLYLLEQKYPGMWMWSWYHQPQKHTGRWVTEKLPVCFITVCFGSLCADHQSTDYFSDSFSFMLPQLPSDSFGWSQTFCSTSVLLPASWSLTYLDAEHHRGVAYSTGHPSESH